MHYRTWQKAVCVASSAALAATMVVAPLGGVASAEAATNDAFWTAPTAAATIDSNALTTYGVRAGSAGPDFLGITNTNYDFTAAGAHAKGQYDYSGVDFNSTTVAGLAIWATSVNENANPYYANLFYNKVSGGTATQATTWSANPDSSAWGDSDGQDSVIAGTSIKTINGLEYKPDIIFGANKTTNWNNFSAADTNIGKAITDKTTGYDNYNPTFANNDSTNLWTQVYTINKLASVADGLTKSTGKTTRYNNSKAMTSALAYEKSLRGNLLYIASQLDTGKAKKKTVAYLYAIDSSDTGYFFVPEANGLTNGNDTSETANSAQTTPDATYAGNNGTIDLDYMDTLPFITNTFKNGAKVPGGIVMKCEDIWKSNPAVSVDSSKTTALAGVDTIIYNSTVNTDLSGTSGGKNSSGISNKAALTTGSVTTWAKAHGFDGTQVIAGDDYGTSGNQGYGTVATTEAGMSPLLYCQRNYTTDKPARAVWAFSQVYSELYPNADASYAYWVKNVYHVNMNSVGAVVKYMTNQSDTVTYTDANNATMEANFQTGINWWSNTGSKSNTWSKYAYYNGSSRASYYNTTATAASSEESADTIGIFAPSSELVASYKTTPTPAKKAVTTFTVNTKTVTAKAIAAAAKKAGATAKTATSITLGSKVKTIKAKAFKSFTKVKTVTVKTKKLTKKSVKNALKSSKVKTIKVKIGSKKVNKKYVKAYKKIFTKKIAGKKAAVK